VPWADPWIDFYVLLARLLHPIGLISCDGSGTHDVGRASPSLPKVLRLLRLLLLPRHLGGSSDDLRRVVGEAEFLLHCLSGLARLSQVRR
jgi:hypothetical protein